MVPSRPSAAPPATLSAHSDTVDSATLGGRVASAVGVVSVFAVLLGFH